MRRNLLTYFLQKSVVTLMGCSVLSSNTVFANVNLPANTGTYYHKLAKRKKENEINGRVTDIYGKPLVDVTVQIKNTQTSVRTDNDGRFSISADDTAILIFSLPGFAMQETAVGSQRNIIVQLVEAPYKPTTFNALYSTPKKTVSVGAISEIYTPELLKTVSTPITGTLTGRLAGLYVTQTTGEPGNDDNNFLLRGQAPFVLIDGTPQSFPSINPEQIESITLLKDAVSTAMFGIRSANGILQITTKKGFEGPQRISLTAYTGISRPTAKPKTLNAFDYATLYNEALINDGRATVYSPADLEAYRTGTDPQGHPNVNWQNEVLKRQSAYSRYDLQIAGGKQAAKYFVNLDYLDQPGLFKTSPDATNNTNSSYKRYIFRSNIQIDLSKYISTKVNLFGRIQDSNQPGAQTAPLYSSIINTPANAYPIFNTNGSLAGTQDYQANIYGNTFNSGYRPTYERDFKVDLSVKGKLDAITKGLWAKATVALNGYLRQAFNRSRAQVTFLQTGATGYTQFGAVGDQQNAVLAGSQNRFFYSEASLGYNKSIGKNNLEAQVLASNDSRMTNSELGYTIKGVSGRAAYNYNEKYIAEFSFGYNGSDRYPANNRNGFFPAVGLGWNIAKEDFLKETRWINELKLRTSYGKTGNFTAGYYTYNQYYIAGTNYNLGTTPTVATGIALGTLANPNLTWEKSTKFNVGFDASLFNNKLTITADYFNNKNYDLLQTIGGNTSITGFTYPQLNIGENRYSGPELQISYNDHKGAFNYFVSPNISMLKSKVLYQNEVFRQNAYQLRTGQPVGQLFGYVADGLFQSTAEIAASAKPSNFTIVPGDIKYKDLNNDGLINANDQTAIGNTKPLIYYGLNFGGSWKGLDLTVLLQGVQNRSIDMLGSYYVAFQGNHGQAYEHNLDRWTPQTASTATYPRLTAGTNYNNDVSSSFWIKSGNYMRLKNIELGYSLPVAVIKKAHLAGARIFINGTNLLTFTGLKDRDPENYTYLYPIQKLLTAGVNIKF